MSQPRSSDVELRELYERIAHWRANRQSREMPAELWAAAASAARRLGVSCVATALGVGYASLKARAGSAAPRSAVRRTPFVEVSGAQLLCLSPPGAVTIELSRGDSRLTITLPAANGPDVAAVVTAFSRS